MAKPMDDEEDALSMVMGSAPSEEDGEGVESAEEEAAEPQEKADPGRVLDEIQGKLEELRGLVASV